MNAPAAGPELRDIHLPPAPGWWPPAPGWWLLAALAIAVIFFLLRWLSRRWRERRWRRRVHGELERIAAAHAGATQVPALTAELSLLLRRVARLIEADAPSLRDEAWLCFLDRQLPPPRAANEPFRTGVGRALIDAPYRHAGDPALQAVDARALLDLVRAWLAAALPRRRAHA